VERLETLGVPVYGYRTERFPAFYRRDGGRPVDCGFETIESLAEAVRVHWSLGTGAGARTRWAGAGPPDHASGGARRAGTGIVVANPIPPEHELPLDLYEPALERALADAAVAGARGRDVTPFLLERLRLLTEGRSVLSNLALLRHNARVAAALAGALAPGRGQPRAPRRARPATNRAPKSASRARRAR